MRKMLVVVALVAVLAAGLYFVFGRDGAGLVPLAGGDADAPLAFVPADTPYLIANLEPMPQATIDAWLKQSEPMVQMWRTQYEIMLAASTAAPHKRWLQALDAELKGKSIQQSMQAMGLDMRAHSAIYGIGLVPVIRMTLADPAALRAFVARVEAGAGEKIPAATIEGVDYWQLSDPEAKLRAIVALQGNHLVATIAPVGDDSALRTLLGIDRPAAAMGDGKELRAINEQYGYLPFATGYLDTARLVGAVTAAPTPLETAFLTALDITKPAIDATCQAEYGALAAIVPRMVMGYTVLEPKVSTNVSLIELRRDVAQDLMRLRAPMPGLDGADAAVFNLGISLKIGELPALVNKWTGAVSNSPWKCDSLAWLNEAAAEGGAQATNPAVFAAAPVFHGFHAVLTRFEMKSLDATPDFSGKLLIGSPNPAALVGMAQSFVPQLAQIQLAADGKVHAVPALDGLPPGVPAHIAMTDKLLGIAVGAGEETTLLAAMKTDPARQPLLVVGYSGQAFMQFAEQMQTTMDAIGDDAQRAETEKSLQMMRDMYALIRRIDVRVELTENGIEFRQTGLMK